MVMVVLSWYFGKTTSLIPDCVVIFETDDSVLPWPHGLGHRFSVYFASAARHRYPPQSGKTFLGQTSADT